MAPPFDPERTLVTLAPLCAERAAEHDSEATFVSEAYAALRDRRAFSALVPEALGGSGRTHAEMCDFLCRLARACPSTALALSMHQHLVAAAAANHAAGRPGRALLEKVGGSEAILVSTGANDWLDSNGSAERVEGGWRVTAVKPFASGSPMGDALVTSVAWDDAPDGPEVLHFPVSTGAEGVRMLGDWDSLGMRGTGSQTIRLDGVFVPESAVALRRPRGPFHPAFAVILTVALPLIMSAYLGVAEEAAARAHAPAEARRDAPETQIAAGEMETHLARARLAVAEMVRAADGYGFAPTAALASDALVRKSIAAEAVIATVEGAMELAGGAAFLRRTGIERLLRDVHGAPYHPLPARKQQIFTGRLALGLDPVGEPSAPPAQRAA